MGLQSLEVFARDFTQPPSDTPVSVSADIEDCLPGQTLYYRTVVRAGEKEALGEIKAFQLSESTDTPIIHHVRPHLETAEKKVFQVRANAMGSPATLEWRLDDGDRGEIPLGWDSNPVHRYITLPGLTAGHHRLTVTARNADETVASTEITWETPG